MLANTFYTNTGKKLTAWRGDRWEDSIMTNFAKMIVSLNASELVPYSDVWRIVENMALKFLVQ
jgi:hypothetical protein